MTAKAHGMDDQCQLILDASGLTEDQIALPELGKPVDPPRIIVPTHKANWPVKAASHSFFEKALLGEVDGLEDGSGAAANGLGDEGELDGEEANRDGGLDAAADEEDDAEGWDMGDDINVEVESDFVEVAGVEGATGGSEADTWSRNSPIAADHVAGGSFDTAMQLLNRQVAAVHFEPLKPRFLEIFKGSRTFLPAMPGLPPLINYVRRNPDETDMRKVLPIIPRDLEFIASNDLQEGYTAMKTNRLEDGLRIFKRILHALLVNAVGTQAQVAEAKKIITSATEYAIAMAIELERRATGEESEDKIKRSLELSAYFTIPKLEVPHRQLTLMSALKFATKHKNYSSALSFANRVIANGGSAKLLDQVHTHTKTIKKQTLTPWNRPKR
jgi:coatomer protein complex subunit alpha (xenin)